MIVNRATRFGKLLRQNAWAVVGAVLGIGLVRGARTVRRRTLTGIVAAWLLGFVSLVLRGLGLIT